MAKEPADRFLSMGEFAEALELAAGGHDLLPSPPGRPGARPRGLALAAIALIALGIVGGSLVRTLLKPAEVVPALSAPDPLAVGSRWVGEFRFRPPITDYRGDVEVVLTERRDDAFRGLYSTEDGAYSWRISGTLRGGSIRWDFTEAVKDNAEGDVVGRAWVDGRLADGEMVLVFHHPGSGDADMRLVPKRP
jgi:hypothetical protein